MSRRPVSMIKSLNKCLIVADSVDVLINPKVRRVYCLVKVIYQVAKTACFHPFYLFSFISVQWGRGSVCGDSLGFKNYYKKCYSNVTKELNSPNILLIIL